MNSIWLDKSGGPFNIMHSGYGVGAAIAPALLAPFTFKKEKVSANGTLSTIKIINMQPPYGIIAGLCFVSACCFCFFNLCKKTGGRQQPAVVVADEVSDRHRDFSIHA